MGAGGRYLNLFALAAHEKAVGVDTDHGGRPENQGNADKQTSLATM